MSKIIVLGSSSLFPLPRTKTNKFEDYLNTSAHHKKFELHDDSLCVSAQNGGRDRRTRASLTLLTAGRTILFDAGPDIRYQLKKYDVKPDVVFITHSHIDATYGLRYLNKGIKIFSVQNKNIKFGKAIELFGVQIIPFRITHAVDTVTAGYKVIVKSKNKTFKFAYMSDLLSLRGVKQYIDDCDIVFADGSTLKTKKFGHMAMTKQLIFYRKWGLKRVIFTHIGHNTLPYQDLVKFVQARYLRTDVAYDGMVINIL